MENITKQLGEEMEKDVEFGGRTGVRVILCSHQAEKSMELL